ncbi:MAG: phosphomannomutase [Pelovirga sp.]
MVADDGALHCFKAYDIRGRLPQQLNEKVVWRIGRSYADMLRPELVVVGHDARLSSPALRGALVRGLTEGGADVFDLGLCGTEEVYHGTVYSNADGGIMVTASHNPIDFNGLKLIRRGAVPISGDSGLKDMQKQAEAQMFQSAVVNGSVQHKCYRTEYVKKLLTFVDIQRIKPLKVVVNAGNGCAGPVLDQLETCLPIEMIKICHQPDGTFPHGIPNPLLSQNRKISCDAVMLHRADLGVAWDGDFDRCFFFDERGTFIEGYYLVGLLANMLLKKRPPGEKIIHDPRLIWNSIDQIVAAGGIPIQSKAGHAFIKERMRSENALYGGEMSAHHYFRDFYYCDSGMIPFLMILELISATAQPLSMLVQDRIALYPTSGEINLTVDNATAIIQQVQKHYRPLAISADTTDGLSLDLGSWRFNLRESNTEPVIRLNVESHGDESLMREKTNELLALIKSLTH